MAYPPKRQKLFDDWAHTYDRAVRADQSFPFIGYEEVLTKMITWADLQSHHVVLDLGIGTGNLAKRLPLPDGQIWGVDFSKTMLEYARNHLPQAHLIQADLVERDWLKDISQSFDRILSAYTFHEFPDTVKVQLLLRLAQESLAPGGCIVIGDISFPNETQYDRAHQKIADLWDEEEYYWCAETLTDALITAGFSVKYEQVSICAGVYRLQFSEGSTLV